MTTKTPRLLLAVCLSLLAAAGCLDQAGTSGAPPAGATLGASDDTSTSTASTDIPWECGASFTCIYYPKDDEPIGPLPYASHVEPGACALQSSFEKRADFRLFGGGKAQKYGIDHTWSRAAGALVVCGDWPDADCEVCTPDPKTLPKTKSSPAASCTGTPGSCSSRSMGDCWHGCDASFGTSYSTSDDRCDGTSDPCDDLGTEDLCESIPGCDWR